MSGVPCSWTPVRFGFAVSYCSLLMTAEAHGHPDTIEFYLTELIHFTLSHYDLPALCPTLKCLSLGLYAPKDDTGGLPSLTRLDLHRLYACHLN